MYKCRKCDIEKTILELKRGVDYPVCRECERKLNYKKYLANKDYIDRNVKCDICDQVMNRASYSYHKNSIKHKLNLKDSKLDDVDVGYREIEDVWIKMGRQLE